MELTRAQQLAVDSLRHNRITVVRAGPGAGKTRLFVEALRRELARVVAPCQGVAALSFTNVAHKEVSTRLGGTPASPHFVGTLDSFYFRFILRPFGPALGIPITGARLVPDPQARVLHEPSVKTGVNDKDWCKLFKLSLCGGTEDNPIVKIEEERTGRRRVLSDHFAGQAITQTTREYQSTGRVSHSGVNFLASSLLSGQHGGTIARRLEARFPVLLIDEAQDTGFFAGRALCSLLTRTNIRCLIVGDPDQTIFKFSGASLDLFDRLEALDGAKPHTLAVSHRCPRRVAAVSTHLSSSGKGVACLDEADEGNAYLAVYDTGKPHANRILAALGWDEKVTMTLTRHNSTVRELLGRKARSEPQGKAVRALVHQAAVRLHNGDAVGAGRAMSVALGKVIFSEPILAREDLSPHPATWSQWRSLCHAVLFEAAQQVDEETWGEWFERVRACLAESCERFGVFPQKKLGTAFRGFKAADSKKKRTEAAAASELRVGTIHSVKGQEFPDVLVIVPKPRGEQRLCPSVAWWPSPEDSERPVLEEQEVAFVACTRAQRRLAIAMHRTSFEALQSSQPDFVREFEVIDVAD